LYFNCSSIERGRRKRIGKQEEIAKHKEGDAKHKEGEECERE
jgi:hypothetical protein